MVKIIYSKSLTNWALLLCYSGMVLPGDVQAQAASLDWLQGNWCMTTESGNVEEVWTSDVAGHLIGMSRTVADEKVVSFEFMRIQKEGNETRFIAQPGGGPAISFTASLITENQLVVQNPRHDFPQQIVYRREGKVLTAAISGPGEGDQEMSFSFNYQRCGKANTA
ncbi:MAG: DUF6265 family protein [Xanthomonadales bacterium]|nr:DUF6265 family protein [Xanthomonadales bacterium]